MKKFLLKCLLFVLPVILLYAVFYYRAYYPIISNSVSFDAKLLEIKRVKLKHADIIAIGSSISLNNINSKVITDSLRLSYYNFGAWGLQMGDLNHMIKSYVSCFRPRYILLASGFADFELDNNNSLPDNLWWALNLTPVYYITNYTNYDELKLRKITLYEYDHDFNDYTFLGFDKNGGTSLNISKQHLNGGRLKLIDNILTQFPDKYTPGAYKSLDSLAAFLQVNKIKLIFVQCPFSDSFIKTAQKKQLAISHFNSCKAIVEKRGGLYLNLEQTATYPDSLFADPLHLNEKGAIFFTKKLSGKLKSTIVN